MSGNRRGLEPLKLNMSCVHSGIMKHADGTEEQYHSKARVLLSGLGADEQLGGYSRHREAYRQGGWHQMIKEVGTNKI